MKKLYLHLGLPKTGSTALQENVLPLISGDFFYAGKLLKDKKESDLLARIREYLDSSESDKGKVLNKIASSVERIPFENIVVSDEMFVVDTERKTWQKKIKRLSELRGIIDIEKVIVFKRDPLDSIYSLYVESYHLLSRRYKRCVDFALESNQALIYKYPYLDSQLTAAFGGDSVFYLFYSKEISLLDEFLKVGIPVGDESVVVREVNSKEITEDRYLSNKKTLKDYLISFWLLGRVIKFVPRKYYKFIADFLSEMKISGGVLVDRPTKEEEVVIRRFCSNDEPDRLVN